MNVRDIFSNTIIAMFFVSIELPLVSNYYVVKSSTVSFATFYYFFQIIWSKFVVSSLLYPKGFTMLSIAIYFPRLIYMIFRDYLSIGLIGRFD